MNNFDSSSMLRLLLGALLSLNMNDVELEDVEINSLQRVSTVKVAGKRFSVEVKEL